jgi:Ca2+-binding RTX toxin-like protein
MIERLEQRALFSQVIPTLYTHVTAKGTLVIGGSLGDDVIAARRVGGGIVVEARIGDRWELRNVPASNVKRVLVEAFWGNDRVGLAPGLNEIATVLGGAGNDTLQGNIGDTLVGGGGNDVLYVPGARDVFDFEGDLKPGDGSRGDMIRLDPVRLSVLNGGDGNDTIVCGIYSFATGGRGNDTVLIETDAQFFDDIGLEALFRNRTEGVELFKLLNKQPEE